MRRKTARRFAERLYNFLNTVEDVDIVSRDEVAYAMVKIDLSYQGLETAEVFAGYVKNDVRDNQDKADTWDFEVEDSEGGEAKILRYAFMERVESTVYFFFTIHDVEPDDNADDTDKKVTEEVRDG